MVPWAESRTAGMTRREYDVEQWVAGTCQKCGHTLEEKVLNPEWLKAEIERCWLPKGELAMRAQLGSTAKSASGKFSHMVCGRTFITAEEAARILACIDEMKAEFIARLQS